MAKTIDRAEFEGLDAFGVGDPNLWGADTATGITVATLVASVATIPLVTFLLG